MILDRKIKINFKIKNKKNKNLKKNNFIIGKNIMFKNDRIY